MEFFSCSLTDGRRASIRLEPRPCAPSGLPSQRWQVVEVLRMRLLDFLEELERELIRDVQPRRPLSVFFRTSSSAASKACMTGGETRGS